VTRRIRADWTGWDGSDEDTGEDFPTLEYSDYQGYEI
jgi:hypothetical protein